MSIKHPFVSLVTDVGGPTYVQPTHWNSGHNAPPLTILQISPGASLASYSIPSTAGPTGYEYYDNSGAMRQKYDFTYVDTLTLFAGVASTLAGASAALRLQYMPSGFPGSWYSFDATGGSGPFVSLASGGNASLFFLGSNGPQNGPSIAISTAAKVLPQPLTVRIAGYGGSGTYAGLGNISVLGI